MILDKLYQIIRDRQKTMPESSYVASLFKNGKDRIVQKFGEEAIEVIIAAKNTEKKQLIYEVSDMIFHLLVLLVNENITLEEIDEELNRRKK